MCGKSLAYCQQSKMAESCDPSSSQEPELKSPGCSHFRRRSDDHHRCQQCRLNDGLTLCTEESPCNVYRDWLPEAWAALDKALKQKQKRKVAPAAKRAHDTMDDSIELHAPEDGLQAPPVKKRDDRSTRQQQDSAKKAKTATSSKTSKAMDDQPSDPMIISVCYFNISTTDNTMSACLRPADTPSNEYSTTPPSISCQQRNDNIIRG